MSDEKIDAVSNEQPQSAPEVTLDDVYKEYGVDQPAQQAFAAPATAKPQAPEAPVIPDPVTDVEAFRQWQTNQFHQNASLQNTLQELNGRFQQISQAEARRQIEVDVSRAVETVNKRLNADPQLVEVALDLEARRDPRFAKLWEGRQQNPQAWEKALDAWSRKMDGKLSVRADPQLAENQRAAKASQQAMAQSRAPDPHSEWDSLAPGDFDHRWRQLVNS